MHNWHCDIDVRLARASFCFTTMLTTTKNNSFWADRDYSQFKRIFVRRQIRSEKLLDERCFF